MSPQTMLSDWLTHHTLEVCLTARLAIQGPVGWGLRTGVLQQAPAVSIFGWRRMQSHGNL
jgi:hypothetical protein